jgi:predicted metal-dependent phosphoesterase TrpH
MRIDMHVHTRGSFDCLSDADAVIRRARDSGLDRICITDHDEIDVALRLRSAYPDFVIAGEEVKTAERVDIIGLFLHERIPGGTPARRTCEMIREQRGIVYVPHPFAGGKGGGGRILAEIADLVDVVEGFNARIHSPALNQRAVEWARARDLPVGAGSDAHTLQEIGRGWAEFSGTADTPVELLAGLRGGRIGGTPSSRLVHAASTWAKVRKGMGNA